MSPDSRSQGHVFARCFLAGILGVLTTLLFNGGLFSAYDAVFEWTRDESTWLDIVLLIVLLVVARYRPKALKPLQLSVAVCCIGAVGCALCALGLGCANAIVLIVGVALGSPISCWGTVVWILACSKLDLRRMCLCLAGSAAASVPVAFALNSLLSFDVLNVLSLLAEVAILLLTLPLTDDFFARLSTVGVPADQEVLHPLAFLPKSNAIYVYIFGFSLAFGFALRSDRLMDSCMALLLTLLALVAVTLYALWAKPQPKVDVLFVASFTLLVAGFALLVGGSFFVAGASALLVTGHMCFELLMWFALCAVASRNTVDAIPAICWGTAVSYLGICAGVLLWFVAHLVLAPVLGDVAVATGVLVTCVLALMVLYVLLTWRSFSFDETIAGVAPDAPLVSVSYVDRLEVRCAHVASDCNLTARESQVLALLARGNNSKRIQEDLGIGRNTVKYHVKNVYVKLGVHSQQELIDMVAGAAEVDA